MNRTLWQHLRQSKPFENLEEEVFLQILFTAQVTGRWIVDALRPYNLTAAQFNVLRILRGVRPGSLPAGKIAERMIHHDPDLTRLLDKLGGAGWLEKSRDAKDRRVVNVRITSEGVAVTEAVMKAVRAALEGRLGPVGPKRLSALADLLEVVRGASSYDDASPPETESDGAPASKPTKRKSLPGRNS